MKKILAVILISLVLLSSCVDIGNGGNGGGTAAGKTNCIIFTTDMPSMWQDPTSNIPKEVYDYVFITFDYSYPEGFLSHEFKIPDKETVNKNDEYKKAGIIDNKEKFSAIVEKYSGKKYSELYTEDFFKENVILYVSQYNNGSAFYVFEYEFNSAEKSLTIQYSSIEPEGINHSEMLHTYDYFITIPKEAITVDGKMIPYEKLNFRLTGYIEK